MNNADAIATFLAQNMDKIMALMQTGFFEMKNGSVTVHFGPQNDIRKIERHDVFTF